MNYIDKWIISLFGPRLYIWPVVASAGISVVGGLFGASASKKAAKTNAAIAEVEGRINATTSMMNAEFESFQVSQRATVEEMNLFLIDNNIAVSEAFLNFTRDSAELDARLSMTQTDTNVALSTYSAELADLEAERIAGESSRDVKDAIKNRNVELAAITAKFGASGISLDSATVQDVKFSVATEAGNEVDKIRYQSGVLQERLIEQGVQFRDESERQELIGALELATIKKDGATQIFSQQQALLEQQASRLNSEESISNLNFTADQIRKTGIANATTAIAAASAKAGSFRVSGALAATQSIISGVSSGAATIARSEEFRKAIA